MQPAEACRRAAAQLQPQHARPLRRQHVELGEYLGPVLAPRQVHAGEHHRPQQRRAERRARVQHRLRRRLGGNVAAGRSGSEGGGAGVFEALCRGGGGVAARLGVAVVGLRRLHGLAGRGGAQVRNRGAGVVVRRHARRGRRAARVDGGGSDHGVADGGVARAAGIVRDAALRGAQDAPQLAGHGLSAAAIAGGEPGEDAQPDGAVARVVVEAHIDGGPRLVQPRRVEGVAVRLLPRPRHRRSGTSGRNAQRLPSALHCLISLLLPRLTTTLPEVHLATHTLRCASHGDARVATAQPPQFSEFRQCSSAEDTG